MKVAKLRTQGSPGLLGSLAPLVSCFRLCALHLRFQQDALMKVAPENPLSPGIAYAKRQAENYWNKSF
ncbi:GM17109 [Drosophila sechellia]|uniref:GM17109 n=1 Tax=Drosophila sechellia TaxID=7238 RepID=B4I5D1_DROSE|nr:GM17109 [Drosophila sechellia]